MAGKARPPLAPLRPHDEQVYGLETGPAVTNGRGPVADGGPDLDMGSPWVLHVPRIERVDGVDLDTTCSRLDIGQRPSHRMPGELKSIDHDRPAADDHDT